MYISLQCLTMEGFPSESIKNSILRMFGQLFAEWEEAKATMFMPSPKEWILPEKKSCESLLRMQ